MATDRYQTYQLVCEGRCSDYATRDFDAELGRRSRVNTDDSGCMARSTLGLETLRAKFRHTIHILSARAFSEGQWDRAYDVYRCMTCGTERRF